MEFVITWEESNHYEMRVQARTEAEAWAKWERMLPNESASKKLLDRGGLVDGSEKIVPAAGEKP